METTLSSRAKLTTFWLLVGLTVLGLAHFFKILTPFFWAAITAYVFQPLINVFSRRLHLPRALVAIVGAEVGRQLTLTSKAAPPPSPPSN